MDIHKPKAAHSVREFLVEIGTITVGILIALSLEAGVEAWRDRELVEHARVDLRAELSANRAALADTVAQERRAVAALDALARYGDDRLAGRAGARAPDVTLDVSFKPMNTAAWESTQATQALTHMPYPEAQALSRAYDGARIFNGFEAEAVRHWYELTTLPGDLGALSDTELRSALHEVRLNQAYSRSILQSGQGLLQVYDRALSRLG